MRTFQNILVYTTRAGIEEAGVINAIALARHNKARLHLIDVLTDLPAGWRRLAVEMEIEDLRELAEHERHGQLQRVAAELREMGLHVTTEVAWGKPFIEIIRAVLRDGHDVVIHTDSRAEGVDSTGMHLLRKCPVPVWISRTAEHRDAPRILAAVDATLHEKTRDGFEVAVLQMANDCATVLGGMLHVVHAWQPITELISTVHLAENRRFRKFVSDTGKRHAKWLQELIVDAGVAVAPDRVHIVKGRPENVINRVAHDIGADLLVIGTVRRPNVSGLFIGQTAEATLERVHVPVLAMKPEGFVSPVTINGRETGNPSAVGH